MTTLYVDNRLTSGSNNGTSPANAWRSITDMIAGTVSAGDVVEFAKGSGPYRETISATQVRSTGISFAAADRSINAASGLDVFSIGHVIRVMFSGANDGQYTISTVSATKLVLIATNNLTDEAAGANVKLVRMVASTGAVTRAFDPGRNGSSGTPIVWNFNGVEIDAGTRVTAAMYRWNASAGGTNEWYLTRTDGSNPSLLALRSVTVDGNFLDDSAEAGHVMGTVGSLSDKQAGYGDGDSLGYSTLYVRSNGGNPLTIGMAVRFGEITYACDTNWGDHTFNDVTFSFGTWRCRGARWIFNRCVGLYDRDHGFETNAAQTYVFNNCIAYWSGHRGWSITASSIVTINNCAAIGTHLFLLRAISLTAAITIRNSLCFDNEAGAIDLKDTGGSFTEDHNLWHPRMTAAGGGLGYVSAASWPTTDASDVPPNHPTTENVIGKLFPPNFVRYSPLGFERCDLRLRASSRGARGGVAVAGLTTDFAGKPFHNPPSIGPYQAVPSFIPRLG